MSHSTPSQPTPRHLQQRSLLPTATPRFSPYPPPALRTSLFHDNARPSSPLTSNPILSTPRSLVLPPRSSTTTPYTNGILPHAPQNTPYSSHSASRFGPHRSTPSSLSTTTTTLGGGEKKKGKNPFEKLTANEFDLFVDGLRDKVKKALDPEVERKRRREEREERQRVRDENEKERERVQRERERREAEGANEAKDVFGEVKIVGDAGRDANDQMEEEDEPSRTGESDEEGEEESAESEEDEEPIKFQRPKRDPNAGPVEVVVLDSDSEEEAGEEVGEEEEEEEEEEEPPRPEPIRNESGRKEKRQESVEDPVTASGEEEYSELEGEEQEEEEEEEGEEILSSRSPTPNSLPSFSPRKPHSHPPITYPSLPVPTSYSNSRRLSSSPDIAHRRSTSAEEQRARSNRDRSPLFRPRNEGSVSLSAAEDYEIEVGGEYYSQEEEEEEDEQLEVEDEERRESVQDERRPREESQDYRDVFDSIIDSRVEEEVEESRDVEQEEEDESTDGPPVSQQVKRDVFGRPIRYQENLEDGGRVDFEGVYEEEEGFGQEEENQGNFVDYEVREEIEEEPTRGGNGFRLEDLVEESIKEADRAAQRESVDQEPEHEEEKEPEVEDLGMIELDSSSEDEQTTTTSSFVVPSQPALPIDSSSLDLFATIIAPDLAPPSDIPINDPLQLATPSTEFPGTFTTTEDLLPPSTLDNLLNPSVQVPLPLPISIDQNEIIPSNFDDFLTPPEAQEELLDIDQVRVREMERLPFLQEAESANVFEGYEEERDGGNAETEKDEVMDFEIAREEPMEEPVVDGSQFDGTHEDAEKVEPELEEVQKKSSTEGSEEEEGEFFGEDVPGDEIVPGREVESEAEEGSDRKEVVSGEDSEDLGPRIPYEAKGKGKALPSPSVDSDDRSRLALSDQEDALSTSSAVSDEEDTWNPDFLLDYELGDLERLLQTLSSQLRKTRSAALYARIMLQLQDTQEVYKLKGGEFVDDDDEEEEEDVDEAGVEEEEAELEESEEIPLEIDENDFTDDGAPPSPDRSAFEPPTAPDEENSPVDAADEHARDQVHAIASQLVDLHSSSNPHPSLHIGTTRPDRNFSSHFRYEDTPQPKLDDPIELPPPPATTTNVDDPIESQQQDEELNIERIVADEQEPIEAPHGEEVSMEVDSREQVDQVDQVQSKGDNGGMTIVDDDEPFGASVTDEVPQESQSITNNITASPPERLEEPTIVASEEQPDSAMSPPLDVAQDDTGTDGIVKPETPIRSSSPARTSDTTVPSAPGFDKIPATSQVSSSLEVPNVNPPVFAISNPTSIVDAPLDSPSVPLPPSFVPSIARTSGPDLSRFSSHFRYEPDGPPPSLDAPLNLPAPPSVMTNVDEPIIRDQADDELEPELQVSTEDEVSQMHNLSDMVDLSHEAKPTEADDFEEPQHQEEGLTIIDDEDFVDTSRPSTNDQPESEPSPAVAHRSRIGATPPPAQAPPVEDTQTTSFTVARPITAHALATPPDTPSPPRSSSPTSKPEEAFAQSVEVPASEDSASKAVAASEPETDSLAADEIRFDGYLEDELEEYASQAGSDDGNSEAEIAEELLSPHKRAGGVLGFSGGAEEFGETIIMNDDSDDEEEGAVDESAMDEADQLNSDVEELDLDMVKEVLRRQNEREEQDNRQVSEAPSSEPISYASSDEREEEDEPVVNDSGELVGNGDEDFGNAFQGDFGGGGPEDEAETLPVFDELPASPVATSSEGPRVHDVVQPGEWDPSQPIEFGESASVAERETARADPAVPPSPLPDEPPTPEDPTASEDGPVAAVVEMTRDGETEQIDEAPLFDTAIVNDIAESVAEALAASTEPGRHHPVIEVDPGVIEEALQPASPTTDSDANTQSLAASEAGQDEQDREETISNNEEPILQPLQRSGLATPSAEQSESEDELMLKSPPSRAPAAARRSPRRATYGLPEETFGTPSGRQSSAKETPKGSSTARRSSRLSSAGPMLSPYVAVPPASTSQQSHKSKGKRTRKPDDTATPDSPSSVKKPRRSAHSTKLREEFTDDETPVSNAGSHRGLRVHHHHHPPETTSTPSAPQTKRIEPPLTRSRCHFTRLRIAPQLNARSRPYEFLVPACALTSSIATETMRRFSVENLGPVDETMHCRGIPLGGRGFDSDAAKLMSDRHPSRLVPDEQVLDVVRRIVGTEIFDEGEVEVLPRAGSEDSKIKEDKTEDVEEGEVEEGELKEGEVV
ncbi:hypothetical protein JCM16303_001037 [Sporobolomyces ruberrimus]